MSHRKSNTRFRVWRAMTITPCVPILLNGANFLCYYNVLKYTVITILFIHGENCWMKPAVDYWLLLKYWSTYRLLYHNYHTIPYVRVLFSKTVWTTIFFKSNQILFSILTHYYELLSETRIVAFCWIEFNELNSYRFQRQVTGISFESVVFGGWATLTCANLIVLLFYNWNVNEIW